MLKEPFFRFVILIWVVLCVLAIVVGATAPAHAQTAACADHDAVTALLAERYGEARIAIGLAADGALVEVWANRESGTWTIMITQPGGPACLAAGGEAFELALETPLTGGES